MTYGERTALQDDYARHLFPAVVGWQDLQQDQMRNLVAFANGKSEMNPFYVLFRGKHVSEAYVVYNSSYKVPAVNELRELTVRALVEYKRRIVAAGGA